MSWQNRKPRLGIARQQLDVRRKNEADLRPSVITRPGPGFGLYVVHDTHSTEERIVSAGSITRSLRPGEVVMVGSHSGQGGEVIVSAAPVGQRGTAEFAFPGLVGAQRDLVGVSEADPDTLDAGTTAEPVTFKGFGFLEDPVDTFRPVLYNATTKVWDTDTLITLGAVTWVSFTEVSIPVSVSATCPEGHEIRLEVTRS